MVDEKQGTEAAPEGGPPSADPHTNRPGMTNGIPDGSDEAATAVPDSSRQGAETVTGASGGSGG